MSRHRLGRLLSPMLTTLWNVEKRYDAHAWIGSRCGSVESAVYHSVHDNECRRAMSNAATFRWLHASFYAESSSCCNACKSRREKYVQDTLVVHTATDFARFPKALESLTCLSDTLRLELLEHISAPARSLILHRALLICRSKP